MLKSVIKEVIIMLLLCIAIILVLGVIFYNYIPTNKTIPSKLEAYTTPENIQSEIEQVISETEKEEITYTIDAADLKIYEQADAYSTGKANPFSAIVDETQENNNANSNVENVDQSNQNSTGTNNSSGNTLFYENTGTK